MGFQTSDLRSVCQELARLPLVSGVYLAGRAGKDDEGSVYVTVRGWGEEAHNARLAATKLLVQFRENHRADMEYSAFVFNYHVMVDDEAIEEPLIPERAEQFHAATG